MQELLNVFCDTYLKKARELSSIYNELQAVRKFVFELYIKADADHVKDISKVYFDLFDAVHHLWEFRACGPEEADEIMGETERRSFATEEKNDEAV